MYIIFKIITRHKNINLYDQQYGYLIVTEVEFKEKKNVEL